MPSEDLTRPTDPDEVFIYYATVLRRVMMIDREVDEGLQEAESLGFTMASGESPTDTIARCQIWLKERFDGV
jgi:hypothetical protein